MVGSITDISDRQHREEALRLIVEGTAATTGREFFRTCTRYLAQVLQVRCASVTELANEAKTKVKTLAFWTGESFREEFEYELVGTPCEQVLLGLNCYYPSGVQDHFPHAQNLLNLGVQSYLGIPLVDSAGNILGHLAVMDDVPISNDPDKDLILRIFAARAGAELERKLAEEALQQSEARERDKANELKLTLEELKRTQAQLIQAEKMSSLGQMLAGVAHEINNPVNFIYGNLTPANQYFQDLLRLIDLYQQSFPNSTPEIRQLTTEIDLDFMVEDWQKLNSSIKMGAERIRKIVLSLRNFSRVDGCELKLVDIHEGIDNTLLILQNRLRAVGNRREIEVIKEYAPLPKVKCYASELNQVFMNLLSNAIDALEQHSALRPKIKIRTEIRSQENIVNSDSRLLNASGVVIRITDNGSGISEEVKKQIFDPFFTTKPVGRGTGLGLAISYQIIVEKHGGHLRCVSSPGEGTEFVVEIPLE
ncbi:MAG: GAF domain-containing protein [Symploca sp. SIO2E9]|nr:GAF domain-containing protein [Symploca sp. SIO2E9]